MIYKNDFCCEVDVILVLYCCPDTSIDVIVHKVQDIMHMNAKAKNSFFCIIIIAIYTVLAEVYKIIGKLLEWTLR